MQALIPVLANAAVTAVGRPGDPEYQAELLSDYGIRSLSARYRDKPYTFWMGDQPYELPYWPAESKNNMFGGNSNWRGPIWFPINILLIQSMLTYDAFFGDDGHGCGAMHQTGWTATVAILLQLKGRFRATRVATRESRI